MAKKYYDVCLHYGRCDDTLKVKAREMPVYVRYGTARQSKMTRGFGNVLYGRAVRNSTVPYRVGRKREHKGNEAIGGHI